MDRGIYLYDHRVTGKLIKTFLTNKSACIEWSPYEPFNFLAGNEDGNVYQFDMRKMEQALKIHKGYIGAVLSVDYSPTGRQFVSGSFDKTLRLFNTDEGKSYQIYHTKRMQKIFAVLWSMDSKYIFSGSDETNIRAWKANATEKLGLVSQREKEHNLYQQKLINKFRFNDQIRQISKTHLPKYLLTAKKQQHIQREKKFRIQENLKYNNDED